MNKNSEPRFLGRNTLEENTERRARSLQNCDGPVAWSSKEVKQVTFKEYIGYCLQCLRYRWKLKKFIVSTNDSIRSERYWLIDSNYYRNSGDKQIVSTYYKIKSWLCDNSVCFICCIFDRIIFVHWRGNISEPICCDVYTFFNDQNSIFFKKSRIS